MISIENRNELEISQSLLMLELRSEIINAEEEADHEGLK